MRGSTEMDVRGAGPDRDRLEIVPEAVLPSQLTGAFILPANLQPEKRLMLAVLEEAVVTYMRYAATDDSMRPADFHEAAEWIASPEEKWPFSFVSICHVLGLEADVVRRGLSEWRTRQLDIVPERRAKVRNPFRRMNGTRTKTRSHAPGLRMAG